MSTYVKAFIQFQTFATDEVYLGVLPVKFLNPESVSMTTNATINSAKKNPEGNKHFDRVERGDFTVTLLIDSTEHPAPEATSARVQVEAMRRFLMTPFIGSVGYKRIPGCRFVWGTFFFEGLCKKLEEKYTYFSPNGIALRADVTLTIEPTRSLLLGILMDNTSASRKFWTVKSGDRLDLIANEKYGDPSLWRHIAEANEIEYPLEFPRPDQLGTTLIIPDLEGLLEGSFA